MSVNSPYEVDITGLDQEGRGVGRLPEGKAVFIAGALPGEKVTIHITQEKKSFAIAELASIKHATPDRVEPPCPYYGRCGGCSLQHLAYPAQLRAKRQSVVDALKRIGGIGNAAELTAETQGMKHPWQYRNKIILHAVRQKGEFLMGLYAAESYNIIPIEKCLLQSEQVNAIIVMLREILVANTSTAALEDQPESYTITIRINSYHKEAAIVIESTRKIHPGIIWKLAEASMQLEADHGVKLHLREICSGREYLYLGSDRIGEAIGDNCFHVSPQSFFQVNPTMTEVLYRQASEMTVAYSNSILIDAYCGTGTIGLSMAASFKHVTGIESNLQSVEDARHNALLNGITNSEFIHGRTEDKLAGLMREQNGDIILLVDPPRAGLDRKAVDTICEACPPIVIYISCNPATLARDVKLLTASGYIMKEVRVVDMFAMTGHVEVVIMMTYCGFEGK